MSSEIKRLVVKCWNCEKKFTIAIEANPSITIYKGFSPSAEPSPKKTRLLKTCPYCGKENEIEI